LEPTAHEVQDGRNRGTSTAAATTTMKATATTAAQQQRQRRRRMNGVGERKQNNVKAV
jgi:hypothetical protein